MVEVVVDGAPHQDLVPCLVRAHLHTRARVHTHRDTRMRRLIINSNNNNNKNPHSLPFIPSHHQSTRVRGAIQTHDTEDSCFISSVLRQSQKSGRVTRVARRHGGRLTVFGRPAGGRTGAGRLVEESLRPVCLCHSRLPVSHSPILSLYYSRLGKVPSPATTPRASGVGWGA